jgi:hypothetical protein
LLRRQSRAVGVIHAGKIDDFTMALNSSRKAGEKSNWSDELSATHAISLQLDLATHRASARLNHRTN